MDDRSEDLEGRARGAKDRKGTKVGAGAPVALLVAMSLGALLLGGGGLAWWLATTGRPSLIKESEPKVADSPRADGAGGQPAQPSVAKQIPEDAKNSAKEPKTSAEQRKNSASNLKLLGIAFHNYSDSLGGGFPTSAFYSKDGKPLLSWRVALLPYVNNNMGIYRQFKLDEPWDSPHNKKLVEKMPRDYDALPGDKKPPVGHTFYRVFVGPDAAFTPGPGSSSGKPFPVGLRLTDMPDGSSDTLLVVEAGEAVPWTKPDELVYDPKKPLPKLGGVFTEGFHAVMVDGDLKFIRREIPESALRALITRAGGETVDWKAIPWEKPSE